MQWLIWNKSYLFVEGDISGERWEGGEEERVLGEGPLLGDRGVLIFGKWWLQYI